MYTLYMLHEVNVIFINISLWYSFSPVIRFMNPQPMPTKNYLQLILLQTFITKADSVENNKILTVYFKIILYLITNLCICTIGCIMHVNAYFSDIPFRVVFALSNTKPINCITIRDTARPDD